MIKQKKQYSHLFAKLYFDLGCPKIYKLKSFGISDSEC